jgi:hypothetical protein
MQKYSDFFQTLHDERGPTGHLGRGTHYSVLRAVTFNDPAGRPLRRAQFIDFAVVWDEDHDRRVIEPILEIYLRGHLSSFLIFGERKGTFTAVLSDEVDDDRALLLDTEVSLICQVLDDPWPSEVRTLDTEDIAIIDDEPEKVRLYLKNLAMLWRLGNADAGGWPGFEVALLRTVDELDISVRAAHCLRNENIIYIGDLVQKTHAEMLCIPNFGRTGLTEITEVLATMGLHLGMEVPGWPPENIDDLAKRFGSFFLTAAQSRARLLARLAMPKFSTPAEHRAP